MFKKIKHQLSKIILNKKLKLVFLFLFVLGLLFNANTAQALFGVGDFGIFDVAGLQLDALDFVDSTVLQYLMLLLMLLLESTLFIAFSASLLEWSINLPVNLGNDLVVQGWNFIAGISNALLVLILVFIALAYILKIETLDAKKALPKFILIALLINFSKVFVGVFVDIADIFQNTISVALGADFVTLAMQPLTASGIGVIGWFITTVASYAIIALIPYGSTIALGVLLTLFITGPMLQILGNAVLLIFFNFVSGSLFLFFTGLFIMRISMLWILTIFSPLAFVASVLKTTKKHWDKWLKMLVGWSFLGIMVLFLLGLGLKFLGVIISKPLQFNISIEQGNFVVPTFIYYYLFLLVYLGVVFKLSKENMPEFAEALISQAKTLVKKGGKAMGAPMKKWVAGGPTETMMKADEWLQRRPRAIQALARPFTQPASTALLRHRARVMEKEVKIPDEFGKMSPDDQARYIQAQTLPQKRVALMAKMGGNLNRVEDKKLKETLTENAKKDAESLVDNKYYKKHVQDLTSSLPGMMTEKIYIGLAIDKDKAIEELEKIGGELKEKLTEDELALEVALHYKELTKEEIKQNKTAAIEKATSYVGKNPKLANKFFKDTVAAIINIGRAKPSDIEKIDDPSHLAVRVGSHSWSSKGWQKFTDKFGSEAINSLADGAGGINSTVKDNKSSFEKFCQKNPRLARHLLFNPVGQQIGWSGMKIAKDLKIEDGEKFNKMIEGISLKEEGDLATKEKLAAEKKSKEELASLPEREKGMPGWKKEFIDKKNLYQKEISKYDKSLVEANKEIGEIDNKLKALRQKLDAHSKGEIILSRMERNDIPREMERLGKEKDDKSVRISNVNTKIEKRKKIVDKIGEEMKSWKEAPKEEYGQEKELAKSSLRGALKFMPSEIKEPLREGRKARDQLGRSLADYESLAKEKRVLQKRIKLAETDVKLRKEEEKEFGAGVRTKRITALKENELKNFQGRLNNIIEKRIDSLRGEISKQKAILTEKKEEIKTKTKKADIERIEKELEKVAKKAKKEKEKAEKELDKETE